jgi:hypothetical protein
MIKIPSGGSSKRIDRFDEAKGAGLWNEFLIKETQKDPG